MEMSAKALVLLAILVVVISNTDGALAKPRTKVKAVFVFGDSLVDSGTNNFIEGSTTRADHLPYGETFFHRGTGRFTNGRHSFDFIAARLGLPFMPPFLKPGARFEKGVNFASAGSGILNTTGLGGGVIPLATQISQFQTVVAKLTSDLGAAKAQHLISNALHTFLIASNDLSAFLGNTTLQQTVSPTAFVTTLLSELQVHVQTVYSLGARKIVFFGIAPIGCTPRTLALTNGTNGQCVDAPNQLALAYNGALLQFVNTLNSGLPDMHAVFVNPFDLIHGFIINGSAMGFTAGSTACCGSGPFNAAVQCSLTTNLCKNVHNFVFWDFLHPTERVYREIAKLMWGGDNSFIQPCNLRALVQL